MRETSDGRGSGEKDQWRDDQWWKAQFVRKTSGEEEQW
jgi:hypothetical protein